MMESLLVPNNLYCDRLSCSVISTAQYLTEGTLPKTVQDFVAVTKMVMINDKIVATIVVIAVIIRRFVRVSKFLLATCPDVVHRRVIKDFSPLVLGQMLQLAALKHSFKDRE